MDSDSRTISYKLNLEKNNTKAKSVQVGRSAVCPCRESSQDGQRETSWRSSPYGQTPSQLVEQNYSLSEHLILIKHARTHTHTHTQDRQTTTLRIYKRLTIKGTPVHILQIRPSVWRDTYFTLSPPPPTTFFFMLEIFTIFSRCIFFCFPSSSGPLRADERPFIWWTG